MELKNTFAFHPKRILFITVFSLLFGFSFLLAILTHFQYRAALVSLLVIPLVFIYGLKIDQVFLAYILLAGVVFVSGFYNLSSLKEILLFTRVLVFSYLIYYLVRVSISPTAIAPVMKAAIWIAVIQLPIILLQWKLYDSIPLSWRGEAILVDFGSGTFNYKTDYAMSFFLVMVVTFLLFANKSHFFEKYKYPIALWLSLTVLIANSQIVKIALLIVWLIYILRNFKIKTLITFGLGILVVGVFIAIVYQGNLITENITTFIDRLSSSGDLDTYLSGGYSRFSAIKYFVTDGFSWLGDGPSAYSDPFTRALLRGNTGHFFVFFSEVGVLGLAASLIVLFAVAFPIVNGKIYATWLSILAFISIVILSFTANVMNDVAVFFIYCIIVRVGILAVNHDQITAQKIDLGS
ncbi:MAG: hypothetical protein D9V45_05805 [Chloroflexi bacterium]|nr:MAG: hypothetical protein D9V45_05805 [Chloroflexota bacterium]